jgi:hypothetical protein
MSTKDQLLHSALHGTAMRYAAERRNLERWTRVGYERGMRWRKGER